MLEQVHNPELFNEQTDLTQQKRNDVELKKMAILQSIEDYKELGDFEAVISLYERLEKLATEASEQPTNDLQEMI